MGERLTGKFDQEQVDAFEAMQRDGKADNYSEAIRIASANGLEQLGYTNGTSHETRLRAGIRRFADAFALLGFMLIGLTYFLVLELRIIAVAPFAASVACYAIDRLLASHEPAVTRRLRRLLSGGKAA